MASIEKPSRANIRIEIKNDISEAEVEPETEVEAMEIDTTAEIEDGEIEPDDADAELKTRTIVLPKNEMSSAEADFFGPEARDTRAKRFGLEVDALNDQQLSELYESLGITDEEKINVRLEAIHMYGTKEMSTQDVFAYFGKFTPNSVEWINDESCNVVWLDTVTPARALNTLSRVVCGMPVRAIQNENEFEVKHNGTSILLMDDTSKRNTINVSELNIPIPPGYWRLGESPGKYILLRYAKRTDKKPFRAEKQYGNYMKGLISESKKARNAESLKGNPWGRLAQDWNNDTLERPAEEVAFKPKASKSLLNRLGTTKRSVSPEPEEEPVAKKSKVPRMRMYADEEEARVTKMKELKKIRALEKIEENLLEQVPDLRNRLKKQPQPHPPELKLRKPLITSRLQMRPIKQEIKVTARNDFRKDPSDDSESEEDDDVNVQQRSKVTVIVKKPIKPTVASTIWSRLADEKNKLTSSNKNVDSDDSSSTSSSSSNKSSASDSDSEPETTIKNDFSKTLNPRPGFRKDLKSRLGLANSDHKSPLRIEINNDHYNNK